MTWLRRRLFSVLGLWMAVLALSWPSFARADPRDPNELPPRDVALVVQPGAAAFGPLPDDFQRIDGGWFVIEFPGSVRSRVEPLVHEADAIRARLSEDLGQPVLNHLLVRVARSPDQMADLAPRGEPPFDYASAMAYPSERLILLSLQAPGTWEGTDLSELLGHELTHVALADAIRDHDVPRWFNEGLAIYESREVPWARMKVLWEASLSKRLLPLAELDRSLPTEHSDVSIAYAESADVVRFLMRETDRARFGSLIERVRGGTPFERAADDAYDTDLRKLEFEWREDVSHRFGIVPILTGGGIVWALILLLAAVAWTKRRRHAKEKLALWAREEAEADAAIAAANATSLPPDPPDASPESDLPRVPSVPIVEHEGRWYTLH